MVLMLLSQDEDKWLQQPAQCFFQPCGRAPEQVDEISNHRRDYPYMERRPVPRGTLIEPRPGHPTVETAPMQAQQLEEILEGALQ